MSSDRPWYKRYPSDFIAGTISLSLEEAGAYSYIIDLIHDRGGPIPDDPQWIARVCGCSTRKWKGIRVKLIQAGKIYENDGFISSKRAEKDAETNAKEARKLSESGAKGAEKTNKKKAEENENNDLGKNRPEKTERHTRSQILEELPNGNSIGATSARKPKGATPLADDWQPSEQNYRTGEAEGYDHDEIGWLADGFRDHWQGNGKRRSEWGRTFANWLRSDISHRNIDQRRKSRCREQGASFADTARDLAARMAGRSDGDSPDEIHVAGGPGTGAGHDPGGHEAGPPGRFGAGTDAPGNPDQEAPGQPRANGGGVPDQTRGSAGGHGAVRATEGPGKLNVVSVVEGTVRPDRGRLGAAAVDAQGDGLTDIPEFLQRMA